MFIGQNQNSLFAQDINIEYLSHEFADKHEDLNSTGALITIDTHRLLEKIDREVLTNEEFTYFMNKTVPTKVFCQLIELKYGGLVALKLYRII